MSGTKAARFVIAIVALLLGLGVPQAAVAADAPEPVVVELSSEGVGYGTTRDASLFEDAILVPNRAESASLIVKNVGADDGHLVATIVDTNLNYEVNEHEVRAFDYINVRVFGPDGEQVSASATELADGHLAVYNGGLPAGSDVELTFEIALELPPGADAIIGNAAIVGLREMTFAVHVAMSDPIGEVTEPEGVMPSFPAREPDGVIPSLPNQPNRPGPGGSGAAPGSNVPNFPGHLVTGTTATWAAAAALVATGVGLGARRRRPLAGR